MKRSWFLLRDPFLFLGCLVSVAPVLVHSRRIGQIIRSRNDEEVVDDCFPCLIKRLEVIVEDGGGSGSALDREELMMHPHYACITKRHPNVNHWETYSIALSRDFLNVHENTIEEQGRLECCILGGFVAPDDGSHVVIPEENVIQITSTTTYLDYDENGPLRRRQRNLQNNHQVVRKYNRINTLGVKKLLAVRVASQGGLEQPLETAADIEGAIFGTGYSAVVPGNVVTQYNSIAQGDMVFQPATGPGIINGVLEIVITEPMQGSRVIGNLTESILRETERKVRIDLVGGGGAVMLEDVADYLVFCLPDGSTLRKSTSWTAFTFLLHPYSYFQSSRCTRLSYVVHEIGHGLGFKHSGVGSNTYADKSGYMGYVQNKIGAPLKAFNGHKYWMSQWMTQRRIDIDPTVDGAMVGRLVAFVHYTKGEEGLLLLDKDVVFIRVDDLYLLFNRATGFNADTDPDTANKVTVTRGAGDRVVSDRLAALSAGESYQHQVSNDINGGSYQLIIRVCGMFIADTASAATTVDHAVISIQMGCKHQCAKIPPDFAGAVVAVRNSKGDETLEETRAPVSHSLKGYV